MNVLHVCCCRQALSYWRILLTAVFCAGCCNLTHIDTDSKKTLYISANTITEIAYYFRDAPVPPAYHRSYSITVALDRVNIVVDSYGDLLAEEGYEISSEQFETVLHSLNRHKITNSALGEDRGCTGGTCETISYSDGEKAIFTGTVYHCGGEDFGDLGGDVKSFADDVKRLVPDLEKLLQ